ncbi:MAG: universal stress protein [Haloferacaceae archaeon]
MYDHIVVPADGSDAATRAARHGLALARRVDASTDFLTVVERGALSLVRGDDEADRLRANAEAVLGEAESLAAEAGQTAETAVREGRPVAEIDAFARDRDADLVVVGRQGATGVGERLLGGVAEGLLGRSAVPVLVVPAGAPADPGYDRVLLPTDGSESAARATPHAAAVAGRTGATLHVLNVVALQAAGGLFAAGGLDEAFVERLVEAGEESVAGVVADLRETASDLDVTEAVVQTESFDGAAAGIREYVATEGIDLVVMGSHGQSNLSRRLLGSVASAVVRTVDVPVLVVTRGEA